MTQASLWQEASPATQYAELCNALFEREISLLARSDGINAEGLQGRLKSLPHYIKRTAHLMTQVQSPMLLDPQNASWSAKQSAAMPVKGQAQQAVWQWYTRCNIQPGLIVPIALEDHIVLDCVDRVAPDKQGFRTNRYGWFRALEAKLDELSGGYVQSNNSPAAVHLLKPNKKVMMAACAGHCWQHSGKTRPVIPSLRELLLSCEINWGNMKKSLVL